MTLSQEQKIWIDTHCQQRDWQLLTVDEWEMELIHVSINLTNSAWRTILPRTLFSIYGAHLHKCLFMDSKPDICDRAWVELHRCLMHNGLKIINKTQLEDCVQETCLRLFTTLQQHPLTRPSAIWSFSLEVLRKINIDRHRSVQTQKRGSGKVQSLEQLEDDGWEMRLITIIPQRETELRVSSADYRHHLHTLLQHLPTSQQREIAHAYFFDNLRPVDIARQMHKKPYQIRQIKQDIIKKMRALPEFSAPHAT